MFNSSSKLFVLLTTLLIVAIILSLSLGPVSIGLSNIGSVLWRAVGFDVASTPALEQAQLIISQIRLPRALLGLAVGAVLALSGVAMQGLFRNPLADPGLIGV
ncbi:MAG: iron chelate uptake ABC transporter family permease subunit, partial [Gammaproteobacteria bacterium]|nr:iron chelate uptake ABC transporter family permease subunit [Gammaproteobacteria bacterium]